MSPKDYFTQYVYTANEQDTIVMQAVFHRLAEYQAINRSTAITRK